MKYAVGMVYDVDANLAKNLISRGLAEEWNPVTETQEMKTVIEVKEETPVAETVTAPVIETPAKKTTTAKKPAPKPKTKK